MLDERPGPNYSKKRQRTRSAETGKVRVLHPRLDGDRPDAHSVGLEGTGHIAGYT
jgi:hypothetical protein